MSRRDTRATAGLARALVGVLVVSLMPWRAFAAETASPHSPLRSALAEVRPQQPLPPRPAVATPVRRAEKAQPTPGTDSPAFFKTRTGVLVLVVAGAGAGYALYSTSHDRIKSPGKE